ncbi:MAG: response regulator [Alphaproteobacteria bacterium]|nr:response regulator [Alphaproteobacteria bacterium]
MSQLNTILQIEDDRVMRRIVKEALENDFLILEASNIDRAMQIIDQHNLHLILLDLNLDGVSALKFISDFKERVDVPLIVLSGEKEEEKKVESFECGADDFVEKPFNINTLKARIRSHLRRFRATDEFSKLKQEHESLIRFGKWTLDFSKFQVFSDGGESAGLTRKEFDLVKLLIQNAGQVLTRHELSENIREDQYVPSPRAIDVKITRIRKKMCDDPFDPQIIKTVRGAGYIFNETSMKVNKERQKKG